LGDGRVLLLGPIGAETALRLAASAEIDGVVAMTHDQATVASKLLDWTLAVNVTWGLPFVRTSVDHGVAYDAAERGTADAAGMASAVRMADRLTTRLR
jgi:4-hydroxythreonine-4-phosphate dehydrogenase